MTTTEVVFGDSTRRNIRWWKVQLHKDDEIVLHLENPSKFKDQQYSRSKTKTFKITDCPVFKEPTLNVSSYGLLCYLLKTVGRDIWCLHFWSKGNNNRDDIFVRCNLWTQSGGSNWDCDIFCPQLNGFITTNMRMTKNLWAHDTDGSSCKIVWPMTVGIREKIVPTLFKFLEIISGFG